MDECRVWFAIASSIQSEDLQFWFLGFAGSHSSPVNTGFVFSPGGVQFHNWLEKLDEVWFSGFSRGFQRLWGCQLETEGDERPGYGGNLDRLL